MLGVRTGASAHAQNFLAVAMVLNADALAGAIPSAFAFLGPTGKHHLDWALHFIQSRRGERACPAIHLTTQTLPPLEGRGGRFKHSLIFFGAWS